MNIKCGYDSFMRNALTYPPTGPIPTAPDSTKNGCNLWEYSVSAAIYVNPCFNIYHIIDFCPFLWDQLGFPSFGWGPSDYFNRSDVQKAINAPPTDYVICGDDSLGLDSSPPSALGPLPKVIEMTNNVLIGGGWLDYLLLTNGTLVTIQSTYGSAMTQQYLLMVVCRYDMEWQTRLPRTTNQSFLRPVPSRFG